MNYPRILQVAIIFVLIFFTSPLLAASEGELYWVVSPYSNQHFPYDANSQYNGGLEAIDAACRQSASPYGNYVGTVNMLDSSGNLPALKMGYCRVKRPLINIEFDGNLYTAVLHCNGVAREMMDDSNCKAPALPYKREQNLGLTDCDQKAPTD